MNTYLLSSSLHHGHHLSKSMLVPLEKVCDDDCDTPTYPRHAMDEHIRLFSRLFYEVVGELKMPIYQVFFMILRRNVQVVRDIFSLVRNQTTPCN